jgi:hypothetical protein
VADHNGRIAIDQPNQETFDYLVYATFSVDLNVLTLMDGWYLKEVLLSALESEQFSREMCKQGLRAHGQFSTRAEIRLRQINIREYFFFVNESTGGKKGASEC